MPCSWRWSSRQHGLSFCHCSLGFNSFINLFPTVCKRQFVRGLSSLFIIIFTLLLLTIIKFLTASLFWASSIFVCSYISEATSWNFTGWFWCSNPCSLPLDVQKLDMGQIVLVIEQANSLNFDIELWYYFSSKFVYFYGGKFIIRIRQVRQNLTNWIMAFAKVQGFFACLDLKYCFSCSVLFSFYFCCVYFVFSNSKILT